jgi:AAA+ superfamily predicted ATPase
MAPFSWTRRDFSTEIDNQISVALGCRELHRFQVHTKELPQYRFVDLHRAAEQYSQARDEVVKLESEHEEDLNTILHAKRPQWSSGSIKRPRNVAWPVGPDQEVALPVDRFWLCRATSPPTRDPLILRVRYEPCRERAILEVASPDAVAAEACGDSIIKSATERSIYRNKVLELAFEPGTKDEFGDIESPTRLRVLFKAHERVDDDDIMIDEEVRQTLWRNVIDLHLNRDLLKSHHVPVRRGVLLYGPPGTGKTFACRYLCGKLPDTTRIIVTGTALFQVNSIFSLARLLQPSLLILEDVDLVFATREVNLYSSALGELLDQMDGLRPFEDVSFVLTTNAIERMEAAIRDRPGRISQCIYFAPPNPELRKRYLLHYLRLHGPLQLNIEELVEQSNGATQAFLKEWVHRSVQIATERLGVGQDKLELSNEDFRKAMKEMRRFSEGSTGRIIGFHE